MVCACSGATKQGSPGAGGSGTTTGAAGATGGAGSAAGPDAGKDVASEDGTSPGSLPDFASGTRLQAVVYVTADGNKLWHAWRDTGRGNELCHFTLADDGRMHCLPDHQTSHTFADPLLVQPFVVKAPCDPGPVPAYAAIESSVATCGKVALFKRGALVTPTTIFYDQPGSTGPSSPMPNFQYFATGPKEDATAFVAAEEIHDPRGTDLMARYYRGEDGSLQALGAYDPSNKQACAPLVPDILDRCLPDPLPYDPYRSLFADASCKIPLVEVDLGVCRPYPPSTSLFGVPTGKSCNPIVMSWEFYRLLPSTATPFVLTTAGSGATTCSVPQGIFTAPTWGQGAKVAVTSFPSVQTIDVGTGRVKVRYLADGAGRKIVATSLIDSTTGLPCEPFMLDGVLRCTPPVWPALGYRDDKCSMALLLQNSGCNPPLPAFVTTWDQARCGPDTFPAKPHLYAVGGPSVGYPSYYLQGSCFRVGDPGGQMGFPLTEQPLTGLPVVTEE
jgi:hypothetical protein